MFRYNTLITTAAILTQALSFQIAYKASTVNFFSASASANLGVIPMKRGHHRTDTFLFYKNKEFEDDAEDTNTKQLQVEANTNANTNTNTNSAVVDVETKELRVVSEAPPKKSRVTRVVTSSIPAKKYVHTVVNLHEYNEKMKEEDHKLVVIRFFSHWCKSCQSVAPKYKRLARINPHVTFIDIPITKENQDLVDALDIKAVPFAHIIDPNVGLVEELKMGTRHWGDFEDTFYTYANGYCDVSSYEYDNPKEDTRTIPL
jgi:thiol-disulfide isomerase/thioredoxin